MERAVQRMLRQREAVWYRQRWRALHRRRLPCVLTIEYSLSSFRKRRRLFGGEGGRNEYSVRIDIHYFLMQKSIFLKLSAKSKPQ